MEDVVRDKWGKWLVMGEGLMGRGVGEAGGRS